MNRPLAVAALLITLVILAGASGRAAEQVGQAGQAAAGDEGAGIEVSSETSQEDRPIEDIESRRVFEGSAEESSAAETSPPYVEMLKLGASLAVVLGLVAVAAWAFRRVMPRTSSMFSSEAVKVLAKSYLGPRQTISLVSVGGKLLVIGSTQTAVTALAQIDDPEEVGRIRETIESSSSHSATETFKNIFSTVTGRRSSEAGLDAEVAAAVSEVGDRVAVLNRRLEAYEKDVN